MAGKLIIGCGYLGRRIAVRWRAQGHRVFATTRSITQADEWRKLGLEPIVCDVLDSNSLRSLPNVESIVHCIGLDRTTDVSMRRLYVDGLANTLATLKEPAPRFLYVSSTSVTSRQRWPFANCPGQFSAPIKLFFASGAVLVSSEASVPGQQEELCALCWIEG